MDRARYLVEQAFEEDANDIIHYTLYIIHHYTLYICVSLAGHGRCTVFS